MTTDKRTFGQRLAELRIRKGLSQCELMRMSGVEQGAIWRYENDVTSPKITTLRLLCEALEVTASELLGY